MKCKFVPFAIMALLFASEGLGNSGPRPAIERASSTPYYTKNTRFIEPFTAVSLTVSAAKLLFGFFSSSDGPPVVDFIKNSTEQLSIINQKFDIALQDLEDIKKTIDNVPSKVVVELRRNELKAQINEYIGILSGVNANEYNGSIRKYMRPTLNREHVIKFCDAIRITKTQLQALEFDPFSVPFVSMAMSMEYYLRLNFLEQSASAVAGQMAVDKQWMQKSLFEYPNAVEKILISLQGLRKNALYIGIENYTGRYTFSEWDGRYGFSGTRVCGVEVHYSSRRDSLIKEVSEIELLRKIGLLHEEDKPFQLFIASENEIWPAANKPVNFNADQKDYQAVMNDYKQRQLNAKNIWLSQNYNGIAAISSALYAGMKSIEMCNVYLSATGLKK